jgi:hypothetical protein
MSKKAMKLALEALKANYELINGSGNRFGLEGAIDGYYSGCFDVKGTNKKTNAAIKALEEALAKQEQSEPVENRFVRELREYGKTNQGAYLFPSWDIHRALKYLDGYTTPQQRKPLTHKQVYKLWLARFETNEYDDVFMNFARAIEAAHGIKE